MKRTMKLGIAFSLVFLLAGLSSLWGEMVLAQTSGGISRDYDGDYGVKHRVMHRPYLDVEVWVDKGEGATYSPGEEIKIQFQASRDCYVVVYNIDTRGYVHLLYPVDARDDSYVEGERVYSIPDRFDDYDLTVEGPDGVEYVQIVASLEPLDLPNFPGEYWYEGEVYAYQLDGEDPYEFMADVNAEIAPYDYASDVCIFSVEYPHPGWYYHPRVVYVDRPVDLYWGGVYFGDPWGVEVWIDGIYYGLTPITIPALVVGRHYVSFWYHGCWLWRHWFHVRRDCVIPIWADCHDRYRYVRERFVEKNYRSEKAKRRRGITETGRLIEPVRHTERGLVAKAEVRRLKNDRGYVEEKSVRQTRVKDRPSASRVTEREKPREIKKVIRSKDVRERVRSNEKGSAIKEKVRVRKIKPEPEVLKRTEKKQKITSPKSTPKPAKIIREGVGSKPKATKARISSGARTVTKSKTADKAQTGKTGSSGSGKRRR